MNIFRNKYFAPAVHIFIWSVLLIIPTLLFWGHTFMGLSHIFFLVTSIYHIGLFYFNAYFLYPKLLTKKTWWLYIVILIAICKLSFNAKVFFLELDPTFQLTEENGRIIFFGLIPFLVASIVFRLVSDRLRFEKLEKEARTERLAAELKFLRSQVSPHFLFNMMTNMVSLARQKSDLLEPSLIRLSELLRYMLYDSNQEKITLSREIEQIENYVSLQKLRFEEDIKVDVDIETDGGDSRIEPMLFIPFIENAFKHGGGIVSDPFITIALSIYGNVIEFRVKNNFSRESQAKDKNTGIGLANVRERLKLLYPGKYNLDVSNDGDVFSVYLKLDLS
ncbi:MAG: histidine kinase [Chitinophagaceae bacterium]|nr:histidine kinase [Chitinophagaceae bacterium]